MNQNKYQALNLTGFDGRTCELWCEDISDGHHTMTELYNHRHALFCALLNRLDFNYDIFRFKSKLHHDGTMFNNWFIAGIIISKSSGRQEQITYHLPLKWWDKLRINELERAPEWDGHNSSDVIDRLLNL